MLILVAIAALAQSSAPGAQTSRPAAGSGFLEAYDAWDAGDYVVALERLKALVPAADARTFEQIALLTGELYRTHEITSDARNPSFAAEPAGHVMFETGPSAAPVVRIVSFDPGTSKTVAVAGEFPGRGAQADPAWKNIAYLTPDGALAIRPRGAGRETRLTQPGVAVAAYVWSADGTRVFYATPAPDGGSAHDIHAHTPGGANSAAAKIATVPARPENLRAVPGGALLLFSIAPAGGRGGGAAPAGPSHGSIDPATGEVAMFPDAATPPVFSADGRTLAYVARQGAASRIMLRSGRAPAAAVLATTDRLDAPALSPDGSRIAFQRMLRDDWELFVADRDGTDVRRVTREIQHDVVPRFLSNDRLLGLIGEPRHRRSYLYDLTTGERRRLFHNNTIRTIAPEYIWDLSADGTRVLIQADRDGNTVSPERGLYVVDLTQTISRADLTARLDANLASERALRAFAARATTPLAAEIRQVLDAASVTRVFAYQKALFDFDSKHITQPGNHKAIEYLQAAYASFGYTPELQWFEPRTAFGGRTANVIATLKGTVHPEVIYVVSSHFDSVAAGPGADDNTSGTAALLETARIMARHPQPATIVFASFTGEEARLLGSREFVRRVTEAKWHVAGALNNDMIGWANDHRLDNTIRYSNPGIKDIQHAVALTFTNLITYDALYYRGTDAHAFYDAWGDIVGGIGSYPVLGNPHYHQPHDWLDTINHQLVTEVGRTTAGTLVMLANMPSRLRGLTAKSAGTGAALTWQPSPERDVRQYVVTWQPEGAAAQRLVVTSPSASIAGAPAGTEVRVRAVNARGLEGWDAARAIVQ